MGPAVNGHWVGRGCGHEAANGQCCEGERGEGFHGVVFLLLVLAIMVLVPVQSISSWVVLD